MYAVTEIGETRDAKRLPCDNNLPEMVQAYKLFKAGAQFEDIHAVVINSYDLYGKKSINVRQHWPRNDAVELGLIGAHENPSETLTQVNRKITDLETILDNWKTKVIGFSVPNRPTKIVSLKLGDERYFSLRIGKRVLKKEIYQNRTQIPLFSANIRKPFGYVYAANAGRLEHGGCLWSIDSDFDCRGVPEGEEYSITDHCGQVTILDSNIDPYYLAVQIMHVGTENGFNREYRPSLGVMSELSIDLPILDDGVTFDLELMQQWTAFYDEIEKFNQEYQTMSDINA